MNLEIQKNKLFGRGCTNVRDRLQDDSPLVFSVDPNWMCLQIMHRHNIIALNSEAVRNIEKDVSIVIPSYIAMCIRSFKAIYMDSDITFRP